MASGVTYIDDSKNALTKMCAYQDLVRITNPPRRLITITWVRGGLRCVTSIRQDGILRVGFKVKSFVAWILVEWAMTLPSLGNSFDNRTVVHRPLAGTCLQRIRQDRLNAG